MGHKKTLHFPLPPSLLLFQGCSLWLSRCQSGNYSHVCVDMSQSVHNIWTLFSSSLQITKSIRPERLGPNRPQTSHETREGTRDWNSIHSWDHSSENIVPIRTLTAVSGSNAVWGNKSLRFRAWPQPKMWYDAAAPIKLLFNASFATLSDIDSSSVS